MAKATKTILFVDDEVQLSEIVATFFETRGYEVLVAENARQVLPLTEDVRLTAVVLDVNLADITGADGSNLMSDIQHAHPGVPIVLYTGMDKDDQEVIDMMNLGARKYLRKGGPIEDLFKVVESASKKS